MTTTGFTKKGVDNGHRCQGIVTITVRRTISWIRITKTTQSNASHRFSTGLYFDTDNGNHRFFITNKRPLSNTRTVGAIAGAIREITYSSPSTFRPYQFRYFNSVDYGHLFRNSPSPRYSGNGGFDSSSKKKESKEREERWQLGDPVGKVSSNVEQLYRGRVPLQVTKTNRCMAFDSFNINRHRYATRHVFAKGRFYLATTTGAHATNDSGQGIVTFRHLR